jgi:hypothetical protein
MGRFYVVLDVSRAPFEARFGWQVALAGFDLRSPSSRVRLLSARRPWPVQALIITLLTYVIGLRWS